jgi:hypothetical protein
MTDAAPLSPRLLRAALAVAALAALASPERGAAGISTNVSGSVYVDYWGVTGAALPGNPRPDASAISGRIPDGVTYEASIKIGAEIHDDLSFSAKACAGCHGIDVEHVFLEYMPSAKFNVQAGRLALPFGEHSQRVDQSGHRATSAPMIYDMGRMPYAERTAFNMGVIPLPYVDNGVMVYGQFFIGHRVQTWYGAYAVGGFKGANDVDFIAMRSQPFIDNNRVPALGGRVALTWAADAGDFIGDSSLGASGVAGRYDKDGKYAYAVWGADAALRIWRLTLRGEYAERRTDLNPDAPGYGYQVVDPWFLKRGWYAELEHPIGGAVGMVYRYDELRRVGVPLPGSQAGLSPDSRMRRFTAGAMIVPVAATFVKLSAEYCDATDFQSFLSFHLGMGGGF